MARAARFVLPDLALHIIQRGNNRAPCFFRDADYAAYLGYLGHAARRYGCSVHAYCLMTNHVHLLATPSSPSACGLFMKALSQSYVQYINKSAQRTGTLWEGRFRSCLVESANYILACYRYIELNPVRAGMVADPAEYRWSSHVANAHGADTLVAPHPTYLSLAPRPDERMKCYRELFGGALDDAIVDEIRKATRGGYPVGDQRRARGRPSKKIGTDPISP
jgi:putative transposase